MPVTKTYNDTYRGYFQKTYGKVINHRTWLKYKNELTSAGLEINKQNVETYAKFKQFRPRTVITKKAIDKFKEFNRTHGSYGTIRGCEIKEKLDIMIPGLKKDSFYKCFRSATGKAYNPTDKYPIAECSLVVLSCLCIDPTRYHPTNPKNAVNVNAKVA